MPVTRTYDHEPTPAERGDYWVAVHTWIFQVEGLSHNALCTYIGLASYADRAGVAWPSVQTIADRVRLSPSSVRRGISELRDLGLLEIVPTFHDGLQRANRYRLRLTAPAPLPDAEPVLDETARQATSTTTAGACHRDRPGVSQGQARSVTVTGPACHGDRQNTSKEHLQRTPPGNTLVRDAHHNTPATAPPTTTTTARGTRIPDDFVVTGDMMAWAASRLPGLDVVAETERFTDYWRSVSGQRAVKRDWAATWRNWMRRAHDDLQRRGGPRRPQLDLPQDPDVWDQIAQDIFTPTAYRDVIGSGGGGAR